VAKRVDLTLKIELPDGHEAAKVSITPDGSVRVLDKTGNEITPKSIERAVHYGTAPGSNFP
jgi:hypothetical protein